MKDGDIWTNFRFEADKLIAQELVSFVEKYKKTKKYLTYYDRVADFIKIKKGHLVLKTQYYGTTQRIVISQNNAILRLLELIKNNIINNQSHYDLFDDNGAIIRNLKIEEYFRTTELKEEPITLGCNQYYKNVVHDLITKPKFGAYYDGNNLIVYDKINKSDIKILFMTTISKSNINMLKTFIISKPRIYSLPDYEFINIESYKRLIFRINGSHTYTKEGVTIEDLRCGNINKHPEPAYHKTGTYIRITDSESVDCLKQQLLALSV